MSRFGVVAGNGRRRALAVAAMAAMVVLAGCTPSGPTSLLTDPHEIVVRSVRATAGLSYARIHADLGMSMAAFGAGVGGNVRATLDADVDLAHRLMAGRTSTQLPPGFAQGGGNAAQVSEFISLPNAQFSRNAGAGRWTKVSMGGLGGPVGPTNVQIAAALESLAGNAGVRLELGDAASCSLGTCYHVTATVDGKVAFLALAAAFGQPGGDSGGVVIPPLVFELLIDQATGVLSEVRIQTSIQGTSVQVAATISNPDVVVQIVAPPPGIVDDVMDDFGQDPSDGILTPEPFPLESDPFPLESDLPLP
jgi:hypothetical protein